MRSWRLSGHPLFSQQFQSGRWQHIAINCQRSGNRHLASLCESLSCRPILVCLALLSSMSTNAASSTFCNLLWFLVVVCLNVLTWEFGLRRNLNKDRVETNLGFMLSYFPLSPGRSEFSCKNSEISEPIQSRILPGSITMWSSGWMECPSIALARISTIGAVRRHFGLQLSIWNDLPFFLLHILHPNLVIFLISLYFCELFPGCNFDIERIRRAVIGRATKLILRGIGGSFLFIWSCELWNRSMESNGW